MQVAMQMDGNMGENRKEERHALIKQDEFLCADCGRCVRECEQGVFAFDEDGFVYLKNPDACIGCGTCIKFCGLGALDLVV
jgi:NAD-dependent dihydropyrimidine dehydrogenase PreA subunit